MTNRRVRAAAREQLVARLPEIDTSFGLLLAARERQMLVRRLELPHVGVFRDLSELTSSAAYDSEIQLRLAILALFEKVGGSLELLAVRRLSQGLLYPGSQIRPTEAVIEAARRCLPILEASSHAEMLTEQLVRPSIARTGESTSLVRPAPTSHCAAAEELLRAKDSTE